MLSPPAIPSAPPRRALQQDPSTPPALSIPAQSPPPPLPQHTDGPRPLQAVSPSCLAQVKPAEPAHTSHPSLRPTTLPFKHDASCLDSRFLALPYPSRALKKSRTQAGVTALSPRLSFPTHTYAYIHTYISIFLAAGPAGPGIILSNSCTLQPQHRGIVYCSALLCTACHSAHVLRGKKIRIPQAFATCTGKSRSRVSRVECTGWIAHQSPTALSRLQPTRSRTLQPSQRLRPGTPAGFDTDGLLGTAYLVSQRRVVSSDAVQCCCIEPSTTHDKQPRRTGRLTHHTRRLNFCYSFPSPGFQHRFLSHECILSSTFDLETTSRVSRTWVPLTGTSFFQLSTSTSSTLSAASSRFS